MPKTITRRAFISSATATAALTAGLVQARAKGHSAIMSAREAYEKAKKGEILLVDIRTPQEWRQTGIGDGAKPITMHSRDFLQKLYEATGGDMNRPVAFICATGSRSAFVTRELAKRGWSHIINISEGMLGGPNGKGWIPSGLPVKPWSGK